MIKAIIIDDKKANVNTLQKLLGKYCTGITICATALNMEDGFCAVLDHRPDLVFLDIEMPSGSGFELLHKFKERSFETIFTTAYNQYALQAFREHALDYLLKPIDITELKQAVAKAERNIAYKKVAEQAQQRPQGPAVTDDKITIPVLEGYLFIDHNDIIRCEALGSYSNFFMTDGRKITVSLLLRECEALLPAAFFIRIHHSHIINLRYVTKYVKGRGGHVVMQGNTVVEVANRKKEVFLDRIKSKYG